MTENFAAENISALLFVVAGLVFGVNIIVEVVKKLFPKLPTTILTAAVSELVTVVAFFVWAGCTGVTVLWYYVVAVLLLGLFVAYAAMFGFDKFKEAIERWKAYHQ